MAIGDHRHTVGFQNLECFGQIKDGFGARRDHRYGGVRQFIQVRRDVKAGFSAAMHAANSARRKDTDPRKVRANHGRSHCGCAGSACGDTGRDVCAG